jgi:hypothetical protein
MSSNDSSRGPHCRGSALQLGKFALLYLVFNIQLQSDSITIEKLALDRGWRWLAERLPGFLNIYDSMRRVSTYELHSLSLPCRW